MTELNIAESNTALSRDRVRLSDSSRRAVPDVTTLAPTLPLAEELGTAVQSSLRAMTTRTIPLRVDLMAALVRSTGGFGAVLRIPLQTSAEDFPPRFAALERAVAAELVEDGESHPAEAELREFVQDLGVSQLAREIFADSRKPGRTASFLRLLGRIAEVLGTDRRVLVNLGLASNNGLVRDAAVQAVESWRDPDLVDLLRAHDEPDANIAGYARGVIEDLEG